MAVCTKKVSTDESSSLIKIWCLSHLLEFLMAPFSSGWITSGSSSVSCCYWSKVIQRPTQWCSSTSVLLFLCWRSTKAQVRKVIFCIFCIFCILCMLCMFCNTISYNLIYFNWISAQHGWIDVSPPSCMSAKNCTSVVSHSSVQLPPAYWDDSPWGCLW